MKTIYRQALTLNKIQAVEMEYKRRVLGGAKMTVGSVEKGKQQSIEYLNSFIQRMQLESMNNFIEKMQLRWWGHLLRIDNKRLVKQICEARPQNKRRRGKPKKNATVKSK